MVNCRRSLRSPLFSRSVNRRPIINNNENVVCRIRQERCTTCTDLCRNFMEERMLIRRTCTARVRNIMFLSTLRNSMRNGILRTHRSSVNSRCLLYTRINTLMALYRYNARRTTRMEVLSIALTSSSPSNVRYGVCRKQMDPISSYDANFLYQCFTCLLRHFYVPKTKRNRKSERCNLMTISCIRTRRRQGTRATILSNSILRDLSFIRSLSIRCTTRITFYGITARLNIRNSANDSVTDRRRIRLASFLLRNRLYRRLISVLLRQRSFAFLDYYDGFLLTNKYVNSNEGRRQTDRRG